MSFPNPVEHKSHDVINNKLSRVMKEVAEESMKMAAVKEYSSSPDNLLTVSGDGTWKTRGHSSLIDSAGKMEVDGMLRIFNRSEKLHNLKYSNYIGDGDTKTFNALSENKPYGDDYLIQKIECVGYVQKRMGTRLRKLILVYSKKKLSDGKTIGGKGRLTDSLIDKLAHYYGNAIRCNSTSVKEMRKAIWAVFGVILAALMMNRCTGFVLQIQIHGHLIPSATLRRFINSKASRRSCIIMPPKRRANGRSTPQARKRRALRASESDEQRALRLENLRVHASETRSSESSDQRKVRLETDRKRTNQIRSSETTELRESRLQNVRISTARSRRTLHADLNLSAFHYNSNNDYSLHPNVAIGKMDKICMYCSALKFKN
ncbi:uncharacterized protein TNCV_4725981 [Trichonephila clavipes]|nr:uncharacterized protein TNCV_4725981 [Trichonephila clavipes]